MTTVRKGSSMKGIIVALVIGAALAVLAAWAVATYVVIPVYPG